MTRVPRREATTRARARRPGGFPPPAPGVCRSYLHMVPVFLLAAFAGIAVHSYRALVSPLVNGLAASTAPRQPTATAAPASDPIAAVFTPSVQRWASSISMWAGQFSLPSNLIATVIQIESCGHPLITSSAGALGLMQVMPYHFEPHQDPLDPEVNGLVGVSYLQEAYSRADGDIGRTLAGYNGGHSVITRPPNTWSTETQRYVHWGRGIYTDAVAGLRFSPTLEAWLTAGGHSMCRQAEAKAAIP